MATLWGSSGPAERPLLTDRRLDRPEVSPAVTNWTLAIWYLVVCSAWYELACWLVEF